VIGFAPLVLWTVVVTMAGFSGVWVLQRAKGNAGVVDVAWAAGIGALALVFGALSDGPAPRRALVAAMGAAWALRLAAYVARRVATTAEDGRYEDLRRQYGERAQTFFFWFFQFQAVTVVIFGLPMLVAMRRPRPDLDLFDAAGFAIWLCAVAGETIADAQLARFRSDPATRGKVCQRGLWRYSRHPNYFFEWVHWFAYVAIGLGAPMGLLTLLGPALMLFFLWKVTGIPATEARALKSRGEAYQRYQRTTSPFIPWFPRETPR